MKVLVVDDEKELCECIAMLLEFSGHQPTKAHCGLEGLEAIEKEDFDLILSDVRMPGCDGIEFLEKLKERRETFPPFIYMSGFSEYSREDVLKRGAKDLVKKPVGFDELMGVLEKFQK